MAFRNRQIEGDAHSNDKIPLPVFASHIFVPSPFILEKKKQMKKLMLKSNGGNNSVTGIHLIFVNVVIRWAMA